MHELGAVPRHVASSGVYPGGSWRALELGPGYLPAAGVCTTRKGEEKDLDFIGQGPLKWGRRTPAGAKDDFLGYWKELLDLILCAFNLMLRKYIFVYHDECTISFVTGAI